MPMKKKTEQIYPLMDLNKKMIIYLRKYNNEPTAYFLLKECLIQSNGEDLLNEILDNEFSKWSELEKVIWGFYE